jgi:alkylation response protein AidB-like acyl-CoA dehydrogenase
MLRIRRRNFSGGERMYRDVRMFKIGGGTPEAQLNILERYVFNRKEIPRN